MTQPNDAAPRYQSYLLRCWEVRSQQPDQPTVWRFSLQDTQTEERHGFENLNALLAFLESNLGPQSRDQDHANNPVS